MIIRTCVSLHDSALRALGERSTHIAAGERHASILKPAHLPRHSCKPIPYPQRRERLILIRRPATRRGRLQRPLCGGRIDMQPRRVLLGSARQRIPRRRRGTVRACETDRDEGIGCTARLASVLPPNIVSVAKGTYVRVAAGGLEHLPEMQHAERAKEFVDCRRSSCRGLCQPYV